MNLRKITSLTALISFALLITTSIILYIVPAGRIAYWADWRLMGMSKEAWGNVHINMGILFLLSIILHVYYNWKPITAYLKNKAKEMKVFTKDFNVALAVSILVVAGTLLGLPPFSTILNFSASVKDAAAVKYGEPPYGHAELSTLQAFAKKMRLDVDEGMALLRNAGYDVDNAKQAIKDIARNNDVSPQQVYLVMKPAEESPASASSSASSGTMLPEEPKPGLGKRALADICNEYGLNIPKVVRGLSGQGINADAEMTMKAIADQNGMSPHDVYELIREVSRG